ncbi:MAG: methyltransferase domain-containing protein [Phycisphaerae bacterium]|nr:methyltransferase domain-containing protein [Phycisphaerae bacterium]
MNKSSQWYQTFFDGLYAKVLPKTFDQQTTLKQARIVKRLLRLRKDQRALDIPCGLGRLTIPLAQMGLDMTGVDLTESYLWRARRLAKKNHLNIRLVHSDMRDIAFDSEFDAAFNWFGSFGYFSDADNLAFAKRVFQALKPGGRFLVEGINKSWLLSHFRRRMEQTVGGVRITYLNRWDAKTSRVSCTWILCKGSKTERRQISLREYNGSEIRFLLRTAGFRDIELYGNPPLGRFTRHSRRLIAVARHPSL